MVQPLALHLVGGDDARAANVGVVVMPFGEHGTLQDVLNSYLRVGKHMDETLVMYYAVELLRLVENVHARGCCTPTSSRITYSFATAGTTGATGRRTDPGRGSRRVSRSSTSGAPSTSPSFPRTPSS